MRPFFDSFQLSTFNFNPRTPDGVRPPPAVPTDDLGRNFNPRTPDGVRLNLAPGKILMLFHFNPRTPDGVRPKKSNLNMFWCDFNPRTPDGVRLGGHNPVRAKNLFQSTHP